MKGNSRILLIAMVALMALSAGCAPATPEVVKTEPPAPTVAAATVAPPPATPVPAEEITLNVWFLSQSPEEIQLMEDMATEFGVKHPGVKVVITPYGYDDFIKTMKLALDSGTGPDLAYANPGSQGHLAYAQAGYILDLTDIIKERGWDKRQPMEGIMYNESREPGAGIYGLPFDTTTVGVFYNKDKFDELGMQPPQTWEEFQTLLATIKGEGLVPFSVGALDGWPFLHYFSAILHSNTPIKKIEDVMFVQPDGNYMDPDFVESAAFLQDWVNKGYFQEGFTGAGYDDQNSLFVSEQTVMNIGGTWNNATFISQADFQVGFFAVPRIKPDIEWHTSKSPNNVWIVSKFSTQPDLAVDYIDFMLSEEVATALWNSGDIPTFNFTKIPDPVDPLQADVYKVTQETGIGYFYTSNTPDVAAVETPAFQKLADLSYTPEQCLGDMQAAFLKYITE